MNCIFFSSRKVRLQFLIFVTSCRLTDLTLYCVRSHVNLLPNSFNFHTLRKINDLGAVCRCRKVICKVACWHRITIKLLAASARTVNKVRLNTFSTDIMINL